MFDELKAGTENKRGKSAGVRRKTSDWALVLAEKYVAFITQYGKRNVVRKVNGKAVAVALPCGKVRDFAEVLRGFVTLGVYHQRFVESALIWYISNYKPDIDVSPPMSSVTFGERFRFIVGKYKQQYNPCNDERTQVLFDIVNAKYQWDCSEQRLRVVIGQAYSALCGVQAALFQMEEQKRYLRNVQCLLTLFCPFDYTLDYFTYLSGGNSQRKRVFPMQNKWIYRRFRVLLVNDGVENPDLFLKIMFNYAEQQCNG